MDSSRSEVAKPLAATLHLEHSTPGPTATCFLQVQRHLRGEDPKSSEGAETTPGHKQSQRVEGERGPFRGVTSRPDSRSSTQVLIL